MEVMFCYTGAKYEENFIIHFLLLLEMISALNLLKRFYHISTFLSLYRVKLVTFDIIPILLIFWEKVTTELMRGGKKLAGLCANHLWSQQWKNN